MITFVIFEDHLLYQAKAMKAIHQVMKQRNCSYCIQTNVFPYDAFQKIYLVELDRKDAFEILHKLRLFDSESEIIVFSSYKNQKLLLKQKHVKVSAWIEKEDIYQERLESVLERVLSKQTPSRIVSFEHNGVLFQIPKEDILMITRVEDAVILHAGTKDQETYQYILKGPWKDFFDQLGEGFVQVNRCCMVPIKKKNQLFALEESNKKYHYQKPYSKGYRKKILFDYKKGVSIATLSRTYGPSEGTIRRWLKEVEYEKSRKKALKYDRISAIVEERD